MIIEKFENLKIFKKLFFICEPIKLNSINDDLIELINFLSNLNTNSIDNFLRELKLNENLLNLNEINSIFLDNNSRNNINKHDINIEKLSKNFKINNNNNKYKYKDNDNFSKSLNLSDVNIIHNSNSKNNINNEINKNKLNKRRNSNNNSNNSNNNNNNKKNSSKKNDYKRLKDGLILGITFGVVSLTLVYIWKETFEIDEFNEILNNSNDINIIHSSSINSGNGGTSGTNDTNNSTGAISLLKSSKSIKFIKKIIRDINKTELLDYSSYSTFDEGIDIPNLNLSNSSTSLPPSSNSSSIEYSNSNSFSSDINELKKFLTSSSYLIIEKSKLTLFHLFNFASAFLPNLIAACLLY
ncbi:hypothetical protein B5S32_g3413 [[Candida] boidinii]|nr:hypothetical protein B5S32_g3413 [[Candida] boidinii]